MKGILPLHIRHYGLQAGGTVTCLSIGRQMSVQLQTAVRHNIHSQKQTKPRPLAATKQYHQDHRACSLVHRSRLQHPKQRSNTSNSPCTSAHTDNCTTTSQGHKLTLSQALRQVTEYIPQIAGCYWYHPCTPPCFFRPLPPWLAAVAAPVATANTAAPNNVSTCHRPGVLLQLLPPLLPLLLLMPAPSMVRARWLPHP